MLFFVIPIVLLLFAKYSDSYNNKFPQQITKVVICKLNNKYHIKDDIINYGRFKYVYNIKNHPIHNVTEEILKFLKKKNSFDLVYNRCPLYDNNLCFNDILIKNTNDTTSTKNNFYFSNSYIYLPQATSLFPYIYKLIIDKRNYQNVDNKIVNSCTERGNKKTNFNSKDTVRGGEKFPTNLYSNQNDEDNYHQNDSNSHIFLKHSSKEEISSNSKGIIIVSNTFRKDNIDKLHFPFFNQMDIYIKMNNEFITEEKQLLYFVCEFMSSIFNKTHKWRIRKDSFDFTKKSLQGEIFYNGKWVEILGCGILKRKIIFQKCKTFDLHDYIAIGLGLDRIAMIKYGINRIRDLYLYITNTENNTIRNKGAGIRFGAPLTGHLERGNVGAKENDRVSGGHMTGSQINDVVRGVSGVSGVNGVSGASGVSSVSDVDAASGVDAGHVRDVDAADFPDVDRCGEAGEGNILTGGPKGEGSELRDALLKHLKGSAAANEKESEWRKEFLYFVNLYNIKEEERDLSFYANSDWDTQLFVKNVFNFRNVKNISFLKHVVLLDVFFNYELNRTSYTYKFVYAPRADMRVRHIHKLFARKFVWPFVHTRSGL
ncbi:phenylalanine--tRNA ligase, putative [Plasmodium ovale]|uniref:Phenylalanine--tRNA ligase, putative n=1 Tax=Plasmodium ovale TaxID=36330 RepID=A0A1C3L5Q0_PLAOA|nr:phenylalanine--tRNA ligase, putative [Plasmodium ovale]